MRTIALGDIATSRVHISLEFCKARFFISLGKTYRGTRCGLIAGLGFGVLLAHIR